MVMYIIGVPLLTLLALVVIINVIQAKRRSMLPKFLQTWDWLPKPLHSLQPYDACCLSLPCCKSCRMDEEGELSHVEVNSHKESAADNPAFESIDTKF